MIADALGILETTGLTPAMVAVDVMTKAAAVRVRQIELNDLYGVCVKIVGPVADVQSAVGAGERVAARMGGQPVACVLRRVASEAVRGVFSGPEFNPLIQQEVVFDAGGEDTPQDAQRAPHDSSGSPMATASQQPQALGFLETQGFTAVIQAVDTACKAAHVTVVGKEKLGGGYVTIVIQGELSAVEAAVAAGRQGVEKLGKLIAAHVIARPNPGILNLLPKL